MRQGTIGPEGAEILGLEALAWLAADPAGLDRFLALTGSGPDDLRAAAGTPGLSLAVIEFFLSDEALLTAFCDAAGREPALFHRARHLLQGVSDAGGD